MDKTEDRTSTDIKILIAPECLEKIEHWVDICPVEISGLGSVRYLGDNKYLVDDVFLLDQECTGADTDIDAEAVAKLMFEVHQKDEEKAERLKFWWHSHVNMPVFWSAVDQNAVNNQLKNDSFQISTVFNKKGHRRTRFDFYEPARITFDNLSLEVASSNSEEVRDFCQKEYDEKVTVLSRGNVHGGHGSWGGSRGYGGYSGGSHYSGRWNRNKSKEEQEEELTGFFEGEDWENVWD